MKKVNVHRSLTDGLRFSRLDHFFYFFQTYAAKMIIFECLFLLFSPFNAHLSPFLGFLFPLPALVHFVADQHVNYHEHCDDRKEGNCVLCTAIKINSFKLKRVAQKQLTNLQ